MFVIPTNKLYYLVYLVDLKVCKKLPTFSEIGYRCRVVFAARFRSPVAQLFCRFNSEASVSAQDKYHSSSMTKEDINFRFRSKSDERMLLC